MDDRARGCLSAAATSAASPILFLHGQPGGARDWTPVVAAIGGRASTIAVERPGWDGVSPPRDLPGNVAAALGVLDAHGMQRATVVGHSFGAAVAAWLAADHPTRVSGLMLVAPAANVESLYWFDHWLAAPIAGPVLSAVALAGPGLALGGRRLRAQIGRRLDLDERYLADTGRWMRRPAAWLAFVTEQRALVHELPGLESRLARIAAPTVVMMGAADPVVSPASARRLVDQVPEAELVVIERGGHLLQLRHAGRVAQVALELAGR